MNEKIIGRKYFSEGKKIEENGLKNVFLEENPKKNHAALFWKP